MNGLGPDGNQGDNLTKSFNPSQIVDFGVFASHKIQKTIGLL